MKKRLDFGGNPDLDPDQEIFRRNFTTAVLAMATAPRRGFVRQQFENIRRLADVRLNELKAAIAEVCALRVLLFWVSLLLLAAAASAAIQPDRPGRQM